MKNLKIRSLFSYRGSNYRVSNIYDNGYFHAIYVGDKSYSDSLVFRAYMNHGDFSLDRVLFMKRGSRIMKVKDACGVLGLLRGVDNFVPVN